MPKKPTYEYIKQYFEEQGCILLDTKYVNGHSLLNFICSCGEQSQIRFHDFIKSKRCGKCGHFAGGNKRKTDYQLIYNYFKENKCELLEKEYINNSTKMKYRCECGNISEISYDCFKRGQRCSICGKKKAKENIKNKIEDIQKEFEKQGCKLLSTEYIGAREKLKYQCSCGRISNISWNSFKNGNRCGHIASEWTINRNKEWVRDKSPNWNPNLTDQDRLRSRNYLENQIWKKEVSIRDNFTCQICGKKQKYGQVKIICHHLNGYHWAKNQRHDINNGISLCTICHKEFHTKYGMKNNTKEQFEEWMKEKQNNEMVCNQRQN